MLTSTIQKAVTTFGIFSIGLLVGGILVKRNNVVFDPEKHASTEEYNFLLETLRVVAIALSDETGGDHPALTRLDTDLQLLGALSGY